MAAYPAPSPGKKNTTSGGPSHSPAAVGALAREVSIDSVEEATYTAPVVEVRAPGVGCSAEIGQRLQGTVQSCGVTPGQFLERLAATGGQSENMLRTIRLRRLPDVIGRFFHHDMRVGAAEAERTHSGQSPAPAPRPRHRLHRDPDRSIAPLDLGVQLLKMKMSRDTGMLERQNHLDHSGNAGSRFQVAEVGLHRAEQQ